MHDLWHMHRTSPQPQTLHFSYEKAGLAVHDQPIPWNADVVVVEAIVKFQSPAGRRKLDFQLRMADREPVAAEALRPEDSGASEHRFRAVFRLAPPQQATAAEIFWKNYPLGQITLPVLSRDEFLQRLLLQMPTVSARLGGESVACTTFVSSQCKGLIASAVLSSPTSLLPLIDLGLHAELSAERGGAVQEMPIQLTSSQLKSRQALITAVPPRLPRGSGRWTVTWKLDGQSLASQRIHAISKRHFQTSLRVSDSYFLIWNEKGVVSLARQLPALEAGAQVAPCFIVCSKEPGMAGQCPLEVRPVLSGSSGKVAPALGKELLVTDGPTLFAPGALSASDLSLVSGFELFLLGRCLGSLSVSPTPAATFTSEGGFKPACDFNWSPTAEDELNERLGKLLEDRRTGK
jgi:hypothetical protein